MTPENTTAFKHEEKIDVNQIHEMILIIEPICNELWRLGLYGETKTIRNIVRSAVKALDQADYLLSELEEMVKEENK